MRFPNTGSTGFRNTTICTIPTGFSQQIKDTSQCNAVADLRGREGRAPPPWGSKFFQFHAVFGKIWQIRMLASPPWGVGAPSSGKSCIRHCNVLSLFRLHFISIIFSVKKRSDNESLKRVVTTFVYFPSNRFHLSLAVKSTRSLPRETLVSYYATADSPNDNLMLWLPIGR